VRRRQDGEFVNGIVNAGFRARYAADVEGLALHVVPHDNISRTFPQYVLPEFLLAKYFPGYTPPAADA
jgi:hypothetical protein